MRICTSCHSLWFRNTWAWGPSAGPQPRDPAWPTVPDGSSSLADDSASEPLNNLHFRLSRSANGICMRRAAGVRSSPTTRPTPCASTGRAGNSRVRTRKDAFHRHIVNGEQRGQCRACRHESVRCTTEHRCRRVGRLALAHAAVAEPLHNRSALSRDRAPAAGGSGRILRGDPSPAGERGRTSWCSGRRSPGCCGANRSTCST